MLQSTCLNVRMRRRVRLTVPWLLGVALLAITAARAAPAPAQEWLVAGPISAAGENALFHDHLKEAGGESLVRPTAGVPPANWRAVAASDGTLDFGELFPGARTGVAYAYTEIESPTARRVIATTGSGTPFQVRLNGEVIYEARLSRKFSADTNAIVLPLQAGTNRVLVKTIASRAGWRFQWRTHVPEAPLFVNDPATVVPDLRAGTSPDVWAQVEVVNSAATPLDGVFVELLKGKSVSPGRSDVWTLAPGEVRRIAVPMAASVPASGHAPPLRFRVHWARGKTELDAVPRVRQADESFVTTYRSFVDGSVQPYSVLLPRKHRPDVAAPLILLLHGNQVTDWGQNIVSFEPKEDAIQVAVHDRGNNRYREIGEVDLDEVLAEVTRHYRIDPDRIYLSGHSMGGYGAWFQGVRRPDRWAAISPQAGYADYFLYHPVMHNASGDRPPCGGEDAEGVAAFRCRLIEHWSPLRFAENLLHVPAYIVHGAKDENVPVIHSRKMAARLKELGYEYVYDENPEGGHWWGPRGDTYGVEVVDKPAIWAFLRKHRRVTAPSRVVYSTDTLRYRQAYWVAIDELDEANRIARIEASRAGEHTIAVRLENVARFTLRPGAGLVEPRQPLTVTVDGEVAFRGPLPDSGELTLGRPSAPFRKTPEIYGPVIDAFNKPFLFVIGRPRAGETSDAAGAAARAAEAQARFWMANANGSVRTVFDTDVTQGDFDSHNLILFGNPRTNSLLAKVNDRLPVRFEGDRLTAGGRRVSGDDLGAVFVAPNPLAPHRYVVVVGGTTARSFETAGRLRFEDLADFVLFDRDALVGRAPKFICGGFFDANWRIAEADACGKGQRERR